jgi:hypothetical protein
MTEAVSKESGSFEIEIRGGLWEGIHAVLFYLSVALAIMATIGVARLATGIACVAFLFYSIFAIVSSPTYVTIDPSNREVLLERYYYFIPWRRTLKRSDLERISVVESSQPPTAEEEKGSKRDLSYYVKVYLERKEGGRLKLFRSGMTGAPYENREKAFIIVESTASALDLPVIYTIRGKERDSGET